MAVEHSGSYRHCHNTKGPKKLQACESRVQIGKDPERVWNGMSGSQEGVSIPVRREENCLTGRIKKDHFTTASGMGLPTC